MSEYIKLATDLRSLNATIKRNLKGAKIVQITVKGIIEALEALMLSYREQSRSTSDVACPNLEAPNPEKSLFIKFMVNLPKNRPQNPNLHPPPPQNTITPSDPPPFKKFWIRAYVVIR